MDHLVRPLPFPRILDEVYQTLYEIGEGHCRERWAHQAVRHKDAGDPPEEEILGNVYQTMSGYAFLSYREDVSKEEALELLRVDWTKLPKEDKLALSPFKLSVNSSPKFTPGRTNIYIGNMEDTTPKDSILLAVHFHVPTRTAYLWGWMVAEDFHRKKKPTPMKNKRTGEFVLGVPYLETELPMSAPLLLDLNRRPVRRRA